MDDHTALRRAYDAMGEGRGFVRIHRLREEPGWSRERFDRVLEELTSAYVIEPHGGDSSKMTEEEMRHTYQEGSGTLYLTLSRREAPGIPR
ncbi:MAG: hypothetical protein ACE5JP_15540 [Candidatus Bipolaricaulia bacterium]